MPRFLPYNLDQTAFVAINFRDQILPNTFEHTLNKLIEEHIDLSAFHSHYKNDDQGRTAYDPAILLKIILYAYRKGITSSRDIQHQCETNIIFKALSCDTVPHFTHIARFVSGFSEAIQRVFEEVLLVCDQQGLLGHELIAIDGCKLPSDASKAHSGTLPELEDKLQKIRIKIKHCVAEHHRHGHGRQISKTFMTGKTATDLMKERVDSPEGKVIYAHRMSVVEPVFGNITSNKGLNRFSLRGKTKVNGQWRLFCLVHNIEKLANYGNLAA